MFTYGPGWWLMMTSLMFQILRGDGNNLWASWWDYSGISGPQFWGFMNPGWSVCSKGRNQSPIDIDPNSLLFDPSLSSLVFVGESISGVLQNNGYDITFYAGHPGNSRWDGVNVTGGPLSYRYSVDRIKFHFDTMDSIGSEHTVGRRSFPVEIQILAYNTELYSNFSEAELSPRGLAVIAMFAQISDNNHREFNVFQRAMNTTLYKGDITEIERLRLRRLLPHTDQYVTYEGSTTFPGCHETVTWVIYNRPIYISKDQVSSLRNLRQDTRFNPVMLMGGNIRPVQPLNQRTVRTNINFREKCTMAKSMHYTVNELFTDRDKR